MTAPRSLQRGQSMAEADDAVKVLAEATGMTFHKVL